jgi:hypothetical protein
MLLKYCMTLFYFLIPFLILLFLVRGRVVQNRWVFIFRAFFPSWKFFEDSRAQYKLFYQKENEEWLPAIELLSRKKLSLFINSEVNFHLALDTLVQRFVMDLAEEELDASESVSYRLIKKIVANKVVIGTFRFKITDGVEDIFVSALEEMPNG